MIDSHIHLSYGYFNQTFPYISLNETGYSISNGDRADSVKYLWSFY